jgi:GNAT superfamily N-acetyltransferase
MQFRSLTSLDSHEELTHMMLGLYAEDPACNGECPTVDSCEHTIRFLLDHPDRGRIILFSDNQTLRGYAILIPYWSNEFAGTLLFIDELFVKPEFRGRGIATAFLQSLKSKAPFDAVAIALEVTEKNTRARRLYSAMGFSERKNTVMTCRLALLED